MTTMTFALNGAIHTGPCLAVRQGLRAAARRVREGVQAQAAALADGYCLTDEHGRHLGVIPAPAGRPVLGPRAPTLYLRRV